MKNLSKKKQNQTLTKFLLPVFQQSGEILKKTREFVEEQKYFTNWNDIEHDGWHFPATSEPHYWCGIFATFGCPHAKDHEKLGWGYKTYVKQFQRSCYRPVCTKCYVKWIARESRKATRRIWKYEAQNTGKKSIHVFFSVPKYMQYYSVDKLREQVRLVLKQAKVAGGALIFHPFRKDPKNGNWYWSPHFHFVGYGSYRNIANAFGWKGWYVGIKGIRKSTFQTLCYLLSHCGVRKGNHTVTWFGELSYGKLPVEKVEPLTHCPACGRKFIEIYHDGIHPVVPPDIDFDGFVQSDGRWYEVGTEPEPNPNETERFDYSSYRDVNENLKGLTLAN